MTLFKCSSGIFENRKKMTLALTVINGMNEGTSRKLK
jgi:hypothetical protein